jgi:hypothetical protein
VSCYHWEELWRVIRNSYSKEHTLTWLRDTKLQHQPFFVFRMVWVAVWKPSWPDKGTSREWLKKGDCVISMQSRATVHRLESRRTWLVRGWSDVSSKFLLLVNVALCYLNWATYWSLSWRKLHDCQFFSRQNVRLTFNNTIHYLCYLYFLTQVPH